MQELMEIKRMRNKYNLTQKELAHKAEVSQSLIAKIESGKMEPTFSKAKKIFLALEQCREKEEIKANEIMNKTVVFAEADYTLKEVIKILKSKGFSQLPVLCKGMVCGVISEGTILEKIATHPEKTNLLKARDIMDDAPPIVSSKTGLKSVCNLLREYPIVLVAEKGKIHGIISKTDVLGV